MACGWVWHAYQVTVPRRDVSTTHGRIVKDCRLWQATWSYASCHPHRQVCEPMRARVAQHAPMRAPSIRQAKFLSPITCQPSVKDFPARSWPSSLIYVTRSAPSSRVDSAKSSRASSLQAGASSGPPGLILIWAAGSHPHPQTSRRPRCRAPIWSLSSLLNGLRVTPSFYLGAAAVALPLPPTVRLDEEHTHGFDPYARLRYNYAGMCAHRA